MEKTIMSNIKKLITPNLTRLKKISLNDRQKSELGILEANLYEIISPFESSLSSEYLKLTPAEMQVASFIKNGATSPEIASLLGLSRRTIDTHRHNIRKKIGIRGKGVNLKTYLSSLT
jgi:DNA-binding CsgD family transcriptional regulator